MFIHMSLRTGTTWLLLLMLTSMLSLRTTVLGYCLCTHTVLLTSECCCHQADTEPCTGPEHEPESTGESCCAGTAAPCQDTEPCPGDIFVTLDHDDFLPPSPRSVDNARLDLPSTPPLGRSPETAHLAPPAYPAFPDHLPIPVPPATSDPSPDRPLLQSWLI